ncbi:unnamed protein product [Auanema sp. JU1783]|nr:unnamed protein product [Auanema sp. JU1783]
MFLKVFASLISIPLIAAQMNPMLIRPNMIQSPIITPYSQYYEGSNGRLGNILHDFIDEALISLTRSPERRIQDNLSLYNQRGPYLPGNSVGINPLLLNSQANFGPNLPMPMPMPMPMPFY